MSFSFLLHVLPSIVIFILRLFSTTNTATRRSSLPCDAAQNITTCPPPTHTHTHSYVCNIAIVITWVVFVRQCFYAAKRLELSQHSAGIKVYKSRTKSSVIVLTGDITTNQPTASRCHHFPLAYFFAFVVRRTLLLDVSCLCW